VVAGYRRSSAVVGVSPSRFTTLCRHRRRRRRRRRRCRRRRRHRHCPLSFPRAHVRTNGCPCICKSGAVFGSPSASHLSMSRRERRNHGNTPGQPGVRVRASTSERRGQPSVSRDFHPRRRNATPGLASTTTVATAAAADTAAAPSPACPPPASISSSSSRSPSFLSGARNVTSISSSGPTRHLCQPSEGASGDCDGTTTTTNDVTNTPLHLQLLSRSRCVYVKSKKVREARVEGRMGRGRVGRTRGGGDLTYRGLTSSRLTRRCPSDERTSAARRIYERFSTILLP